MEMQKLFIVAHRSATLFSPESGSAIAPRQAVLKLAIGF